MRPDIDTRIGVVNKLDRRGVLLTTRSTCHGEIFSNSRLLDKVSEGSTLIYGEFPDNIVYDRWKEALVPKTSSSRSDVSVELNFAR